MSLRKGLALFLLTVFSFTSIVPAQAVTSAILPTLPTIVVGTGTSANGQADDSASAGFTINASANGDIRPTANTAGGAAASDGGTFTVSGAGVVNVTAGTQETAARVAVFKASTTSGRDCDFVPGPAYMSPITGVAIDTNGGNGPDLLNLAFDDNGGFNGLSDAVYGAAFVFNAAGAVANYGNGATSPVAGDLGITIGYDDLAGNAPNVSDVMISLAANSIRIQCPPGAGAASEPVVITLRNPGSMTGATGPQYANLLIGSGLTEGSTFNIANIDPTQMKLTSGVLRGVGNGVSTVFGSQLPATVTTIRFGPNEVTGIDPANNTQFNVFVPSIEVMANTMPNFAATTPMFYQTPWATTSFVDSGAPLQATIGAATIGPILMNNATFFPNQANSMSTAALTLTNPGTTTAGTGTVALVRSSVSLTPNVRGISLGTNTGATSGANIADNAGMATSGLLGANQTVPTNQTTRNEFGFVSTVFTNAGAFTVQDSMASNLVDTRTVATQLFLDPTADPNTATTFTAGGGGAYTGVTQMTNTTTPFDGMLAGFTAGAIVDAVDGVNGHLATDTTQLLNRAQYAGGSARTTGTINLAMAVSGSGDLGATSEAESDFLTGTMSTTSPLLFMSRIGSANDVANNNTDDVTLATTNRGRVASMSPASAAGAPPVATVNTLGNNTAPVNSNNATQNVVLAARQTNNQVDWNVVFNEDDGVKDTMVLNFEGTITGFNTTTGFDLKVDLSGVPGMAADAQTQTLMSLVPNNSLNFGIEAFTTLLNGGTNAQPPVFNFVTQTTTAGFAGRTVFNPTTVTGNTGNESLDAALATANQTLVAARKMHGGSPDNFTVQNHNGNVCIKETSPGQFAAAIAGGINQVRVNVGVDGGNASVESLGADLFPISATLANHVTVFTNPALFTAQPALTNIQPADNGVGAFFDFTLGTPNVANPAATQLFICAAMDPALLRIGNRTATTGADTAFDVFARVELVNDNNTNTLAFPPQTTDDAVGQVLGTISLTGAAGVAEAPVSVGFADFTVSNPDTLTGSVAGANSDTILRNNGSQFTTLSGNFTPTVDTVSSSISSVYGLIGPNAAIRLPLLRVDIDGQALAASLSNANSGITAQILNNATGALQLAISALDGFGFATAGTQAAATGPAGSPGTFVITDPPSTVSPIVVGAGGIAGGIATYAITANNATGAADPSTLNTISIFIPGATLTGAAGAAFTSADLLAQLQLVTGGGTAVIGQSVPQAQAASTVVTVPATQETVPFTGLVQGNGGANAYGANNDPQRAGIAFVSELKRTPKNAANLRANAAGAADDAAVTRTVAADIALIQREAPDALNEDTVTPVVDGAAALLSPTTSFVSGVTTIADTTGGPTVTAVGDTRLDIEVPGLEPGSTVNAVGDISACLGGVPADGIFRCSLQQRNLASNVIATQTPTTGVTGLPAQVLSISVADNGLTPSIVSVTADTTNTTGFTPTARGRTLVTMTVVSSGRLQSGDVYAPAASDITVAGEPVVQLGSTVFNGLSATSTFLAIVSFDDSDGQTVAINVPDITTSALETFILDNLEVVAPSGGRRRRAPDARRIVERTRRGELRSFLISRRLGRSRDARVSIIDGTTGAITPVTITGRGRRRRIQDAGGNPISLAATDFLVVDRSGRGGDVLTGPQPAL